jgi:hypothetical protein
MFVTKVRGGGGRNATCALILTLVLAAPLAAQGFNREAAWFGQADVPASDIAVFDIDGNEAMDAVVANPSDDGDHMIYWSILDSSPPSPTALATARGGRALIAQANFDGNEGTDIVIVDSLGVRLYLNVEGTLTYETEYTLTSLGEPLHLLVGDYVENSGAMDLVIAYEEGVVCLPNVTGDFNASHYTIGSFGEGVNSVLAKDLSGLPQPHVLILALGTLYAYELGTSSATLYDDWAFEGAVAIGPGCLSTCYLAVATATHFQLYEYDEGWDLVNETALPFDRPVFQIIAANITDGAYCDFVLRAAGITYVVRQEGTPPAQVLKLHEIIGYPSGAPDVVVRFVDVNDDDAPDLIVARPAGPHQVFLAGTRLQASISSAPDAYQVVDGQAYVIFEVELDAEPKSLVLVTCETGEEEDVGSFTQSLTAARTMPFSSVLVFGPGITAQNFYVPLRPHFPGVSTQLTVHIVVSDTIGASVSGGGTASGVVHPMTTPKWDWRLSSRVNAILQANGNTYFGGDFKGMTWDVNDRLAIIDSAGRRGLLQDAMNAQEPPEIHCLETDSLGNLYVGGEFTFDIGTVTVQNVAKLRPDGSWDPNFRPNPNGPVYAIKVHEMIRIPGRPPSPLHVYIGGKFSTVEYSPPITGTLPVRNIARIYHTGQVTGNANVVWVSSDTGTGSLPPLHGSPQNDNAIVRAIDIAEWQFTSATVGSVLVIGGEKIFSVSARSRGAWKVRRVANLALVAIGWYDFVLARSLDVVPPHFLDDGALVTNHLVRVAPRVLDGASNDTTSNTAVVRTLKIAHQQMIYDDGTAELFTSRALVFGGEFTHIKYRSGVSGWEDTVASGNLGLSTVLGHQISTDQQHPLPDAETGVWSVAFDQEDRAWVARDVGTSPDSDEAIWVYGIVGNQGQFGPISVENARLVRDTQNPFDFGPDGPVYALVFNPVDEEMLAVGDFTSRPATHIYDPYPHSNPQTLHFDIPATNITAYSTTSAPAGVSAYDFGAHVERFRAAGTSALSAIAVFHDGQRYAFTGGSLDTIRAERTNLAAVDGNGLLLEWGPRTHPDGIVHAMAYDAAEQVIYFAGLGSVQGLPLYEASPQPTLVAAAPANDKATLPLPWYVTTWLTGDPPSVTAIAVSTDYLIIGGDFDEVFAYSGFTGVCAVERYVTDTVEGHRPPELGWVPELDHSTERPVVHAIYVDVGTGPNNSDLIYLGGRFTEANRESYNGIARYDDPDQGQGDVDTGFGLQYLGSATVYAITMSSSGDLCLAGRLTINSQAERGAGVWDSNGDFLFEVLQYPGYCYAIAITDDHLFVGGNFLEIYDPGTSQWVTRRSVVAVDMSGEVVASWQHDVVTPSSGEIVRALLVGTLLGNDGIWIAGEYTGSGATEGNDLGFYPLPS